MCRATERWLNKNNAVFTAYNADRAAEARALAQTHGVASFPVCAVFNGDRLVDIWGGFVDSKLADWLPTFRGAQEV